MNSQKVTKVQCEICFYTDEFSICEKCFRNYLEKTVNFRKSITIEKYNLKGSIQDILLKNNQKMIAYNKLCLKKVKIEKDSKRAAELNKFYKIKQNMIILLNEKVRIKKDYLKRMKDSIDKENLNLSALKSKMIRAEENILLLSKTNEQLQTYFVNLFYEFFFNNSIGVNSTIIDIQDYFEIYEYVKPEINTDKSLKNDIGDFDKIPNVLSICESGMFFSPTQIHGEVDNNYDKFIKIKQSIVMNLHSIYRLNKFIYSLMFFMKMISKFFHINLPFPIVDENSYLIKNQVNDNLMGLFLETTSQGHLDSTLNDIVVGYTNLDTNIKYIRHYLENRIKPKGGINFKKFQRKNSVNSTVDLKDFLNIKSLYEKDLFEVTDTGQDNYDENEQNKEKGSFTIKKERKQKDDEDGFVIIENYYI